MDTIKSAIVAMGLVCMGGSCICSLASQSGPAYLGRSVEDWGRQLGGDVSAMGELEAGMPSSADVVIMLLRNANEVVAVRASEVCKRSGARCGPVREVLEDVFMSSGVWMVRANIALALAALGECSDEVRRCMLDIVCSSDVPRLRGDCLRALRLLEVGLLDKIVDRMDRGLFASDEYAAESLYGMGPSVMDELIRRVGGASRSAAIAAEVLPRFGWKYVSKISGLGRNDMMHRAMIEVPKDRLLFGENYSAIGQVLAPVGGLSCVVWAVGSRHSNSLVVYRGEPIDGEYVVWEMSVMGRGQASDVRVRRALVDRRVALAAMWQVAVLGSLRVVRARLDEDVALATSSGWIMAYVNAAIVGHGSVRASYAGRMDCDGFPRRFVPQASSEVLTEMVNGVNWSVDADYADRRWIAELRGVLDGQSDGDVKWAVDLLDQVATNWK